MNRRVLAGLFVVAVLVAGCSSIDGRATTVAGASPSTSSESTSRTLGTPTSDSSTRSTTSSSTSSSTSTSTTSTSTTQDYPWSLVAETHPVPSGFRAASPNGLVYAAFENNQLCVNSWAGDTNCLLDLPADLDLVFPVFSGEGSQLAVVVTKGTDSGLWIIDLNTGVAKVLTPDGLSTDVAAASVLNISGAVWDVTEQAFLIQLAPDEGADTGNIALVPTDGSALQVIPIQADLAASLPTMLAVNSGVLYSPNVGPLTGQLWWLGEAGTPVQVGSTSFSDGGTVILVALSPDGATAAICPANGAEIGELQLVDIATGEVSDALTDSLCPAVAFAPDGSALAVVGPIDDTTVMTVFADTSFDELLANGDLEGSPQLTPSLVTWNSGNLLTVTPADTTDPDALVNLVQLQTS